MRVEKKNEYMNKQNVLYMMRRDQRIHENYAVQLGYELSYEYGSQLYFGVEFFSLKMNARQRLFVLEGLAELSKEARKHNIELLIIKDLMAFVKAYKIGCIVLDFCPLRESILREQGIYRMCEEMKIELYVCDAHNIVPCKMLSKYKRTPKAVRTDLLKFFWQYLVAFNKVEVHKINKIEEEVKKEIEIDVDVNKEIEIDFEDARTIREFVSAAEIERYLRRNKSNLERSNSIRGGYSHGMKVMKDFFEGGRFKLFKSHRNDPDVDGNSGLSPWINFGQISAQEVVFFGCERFEKNNENLETFINEAFVWREIAEHFVHHESNYDNIEGALPWARESLLEHACDKREIVFSQEQLERARTGYVLWDAAQRQLVCSGRMHGYVRMYWAKQLLWWTEDPRSALSIALYFNDTYALDGNSPNGYLGVMWSICGSMDRAFKEREVVGKIRTMKAFKAPVYINRWRES